MSKQSFSAMEVVIAIGALTTSAAAVYIAWDQAQTMRVEQHASVFPAIQIDPISAYTNGNGVKVGFDVENAGVGPAFIKSAQIRANGERLAGFEEVTRRVPHGVDIQAEQLTGRVLAPGVSQEALTLSWREIVMTTEKLNDIYAATDGWEMEVCYCSTLHRCWISRSGQRTEPGKVDVCPALPDVGLF